MTSRIVDKSPRKRKIQIKSAEKRRISAEQIAADLGAEATGVEVSRRGSPLNAYCSRLLGEQLTETEK